MLDNKIRVIFRVEGNSKIGMGHLMRCLALSKEIKKRINCSIVFLMRNSESLIKEVLKFGYKIVSEIPKEFVDIIITDVPGISQDYLEALKKKTKLLVTIDDSTRRDFCSDIVIRGSIVPEFHNYDPKSRSKFLSGVDFMILDKEFQKFNTMNKEINPTAKSILITMGGSDINNLCPKIITALDKLSNLTKTVIIGPVFENINKLKLDKNSILKYKVSNMTELMFSSDIAIAGGGITLYELSVVGTPAIILSQTEDQLREADYFAKRGAVVNLGLGKKATKEMISSAVEDLLKNRKKREKMSIIGKGLVDGKGLDRVVSKILESV